MVAATAPYRQALAVGPSKQRELHPLTLRQQRQGLAGDAVLEMSALLMRLERGFVAEQLVEQELRGIFSRPADQEQFRAFLALRLGEEARKNVGNLVGLSLLCLPLRDHQQAAVADSLVHGFFVHCIMSHGHYSFARVDGRFTTPDANGDSSIDDERWPYSLR